ncbi:hypothetical protein HPB51_014474 [Rhipicephalus microplus]|uniref:RING-type domain-containing protein n=1 Tax=Rhipicephalus microplus TaxID=6941 RepID=A0A9J6EAA8_RHIMP|nr:hypothetical protein HPB51_014474 [Rhipicephalus microplus]
MPGRGSRQALHQLCDSVSGANWRPTRFQDELTVLRYACCVCHVIPKTTVVLPCSHILCEQCLAGCVIQDGGSVCPIDTEPFSEDECQKLKLPEKKKRNLKVSIYQASLASPKNRVKLLSEARKQNVRPIHLYGGL